jgi:hypothetical protein
MGGNISNSAEIPIMKNYYLVIFAELDVELNQIGAMNS